MKQQNEKYILIYSSSYHGYYIEDVLRRNDIVNNLRKAPRALGKSCNTAIYIQELDFNKALSVIEQTKIMPQAIYEILVHEQPIHYIKVR